LALAIGVGLHSDYRGNRDNAGALVLLQVGASSTRRVDAPPIQAFWISASSFSEFADAVRCCFIGRGVDAFYSASFLIPVRIARCEAFALFRLRGGITRACAINRMSGC
jgi:hypothetical protein